MSGATNGKRQRSDIHLEHSSPNHKRPRASSADSETDGTETEMVLDASLRMKRDSTYYFEDGSCIFLVEDTLFNVHRSILSKDASSFGTMFSLPQGSHEAEGRSDEDPIVLSGDTVPEFRNFLWALYALPPEFCIATSPNADVTQLIDVARVSNKYFLKSLEVWALDAIHDYVNRKPSPILSSITQATVSPSPFSPPPPTANTSGSIQSTTQLTRLIRLAQMCNHKRLLDTMIDHLRQLMSFSLQYAYLAMSLADELDLRTLRGLAYFEVMQKAVILKCTRVDAAASQVGDTDPQEGNIDEQGRLVVNPAQQLRLLSGYYRLTRSWEKLRATPPAFDHSASCSATWHQNGCTQSWLEFWKERSKTDAVLAFNLADVVGRLKQIQKEFDKWGSAPYMHHDCRNAARKSIQEALKKIDDTLPDFFCEVGDDI